MLREQCQAWQALADQDLVLIVVDDVDIHPVLLQSTSLADDFDPEEPETEPDHDAFASPFGSSSSSSSGAEFDDDH